MTTATRNPRHRENLTMHMRSETDERYMRYETAFLGYQRYEPYNGEAYPVHNCEVHPTDHVAPGTPMYTSYCPEDAGADGICGPCLDAQVVGTYRGDGWVEEVEVAWHACFRYDSGKGDYCPTCGDLDNDVRVVTDKFL